MRIGYQMKPSEKINRKFIKKIKGCSPLRFKKLKEPRLFIKLLPFLLSQSLLQLVGIITSQVNHTSQVDQFCEITAPKGHISKCILPDGTEVWINTCSSISYNALTFNTRTREIQLEGEAYFQVAKNKNVPFKVNSSIANINVTGTSFNVKAYPGSELFETVLVEGSIELQFNKASKHILQLKPNERAILNLNENEIKIENVDTELYSSWRNGEIIFKDATLNDLINELERIYDIKFSMKEKSIGEFRFRGMFSYNNNLIDALEKIKQTAGVDYYIENKEVKLSLKATN